MQQEPQKQAPANAVPEPSKPVDPAAVNPDASNEPEQVIRPEDEEVVVERLRELGYIE